MPALSYVLNGLVASGAVSAMPPQRSGRAQTLYLVANRYYAGEAFVRQGVKRARDAEAEEEEEPEQQLADIEIERQRNIARNQEILRQLGLA